MSFHQVGKPMITGTSTVEKIAVNRNVFHRSSATSIRPCRADFVASVNSSLRVISVRKR